MNTAYFSLSGKKKENQDFGIADANQKIFILADGVTNSSFPRKSSRLAANTAYDVLSKESPLSLEDAVESADKAVFERFGGVSETTLDIALVRGNSCYLAHVGDGRAYRITQDTAELLATDHCDENGFLNNLVGSAGKAVPELVYFELNEGDYLAIATDGFYEAIGSPEALRDVLIGNQGILNKFEELEKAVEERKDDASLILYHHVDHIVPASFALLLEAENMYRQGRTEEVKNLLKTLIKKDDEEAVISDALMFLGTINQRDGGGDAHNLFRQATIINPMNGPAHFMLAKTLVEKGDLTKAEKELYAAISCGYKTEAVVENLRRIETI